MNLPKENMKKSKRRSNLASISQPEKDITEKPQEQQKRFWSGWSSGERIGAIAVCLFLSLATFGAGLKYLEESAREQKLSAKNSSNKENASLLNSINPFVEPPLPTATPQLSKEYVYAGSRMLAVEDANASAAPPTDLAVWRPSTGYWYVLGGQNSAQTSYYWGAPTDLPVQGDYDGDGKTDFSVFRPASGNWYVSNSSNGATTELLSFGVSSDKMAQADYDGDGRTDMAVFRGSTGYWYIKRSSDSNMLSQQFGLPDDKPVSADYDGDGKADIAVWRNSNATFYVLRSLDASLQVVQFGQTDDVPVPGDYDGDGKADFAQRRGNNWRILYSSNSQTEIIPWQLATDQAVQNDYDGDGKVDVAVWREDIGYWLIRQSSHIGQSNELRQVQWGGMYDVPVPAFYRR